MSKQYLGMILFLMQTLFLPRNYIFDLIIITLIRKFLSNLHQAIVAVPSVVSFVQIGISTSPHSAVNEIPIRFIYDCGSWIRNGHEGEFWSRDDFTTTELNWTEWAASEGKHTARRERKQEGRGESGIDSSQRLGARLERIWQADKSVAVSRGSINRNCGGNTKQRKIEDGNCFGQGQSCFWWFKL